MASQIKERVTIWFSLIANSICLVVAVPLTFSLYWKHAWVLSVTLTFIVSVLAVALVTFARMLSKGRKPRTEARSK